MYINFAANLCYNLIASGFFLASEEKEINHSTPIVTLMKNQSPVLYVINIINTDFYPSKAFENRNTRISKNIEQNLKQFYCLRCVCINILAAHSRIEYVNSYCDEKVFIPSGKINHVWWCVNLNDNTLHCGKPGPTKVLGVEKIILNSFDGKNYEASANLAAIKEDAFPKSRLSKINNRIFFTVCIIAVNILIFLIVHFCGNETEIFKKFACNGTLIWDYHQYYRLFTCMFLHSNWNHLIFNCLSAYLFCSHAEMYMGKKNLSAIYFFSGIFAAIASSFVTTGYSLGASGAIFGVMGSLIALSKKENKEIGGLDFFTLAIYVVSMFIVSLVTPNIDNAAHIGGFAAGTVLQIISFYIPKPKSEKLSKT